MYIIKEHRHDKIKSKKINKFEHLVRKHSGYHHNHQQNTKSPPKFLSYYNKCVSTRQHCIYRGNFNNNHLYHNNSNYNFRPNNQNPMATSNSNCKWVINLSTTPLSSAQFSLLSRGPNFAVTPKHPQKPA